jgi:hypothetical protein
LIAGALPQGIVLDTAAGTLSGVPLEAGVFPFTVRVTDSMGQISEASFILTIDPKYTLQVMLQGSGGGSVNSSPAGIDCGADCASRFVGGTQVVLTASPDAESVFTGWGGDCQGLSAVSSVTMTSDKFCNASFARSTVAAQGVVLAPTDSSGYSYPVYTVPQTVTHATVVVTSTWSNDWYDPGPGNWTQSDPLLVKVPYAGGYSCDQIWKHSSNVYLFLSLEPTAAAATKITEMALVPGEVVAIAGSDCYFPDNFHAHYQLEWSVHIVE